MTRIAISGATGLLGGALTRSLRADGHRVQAITRSPQAADDIVWDPADGRLDPADLEGVDAVVHLAGHPIGDERWSDEVKREIRESRVTGTRLLAETLAGLSDPPSTLLSGSAVGYYGDRGDEILTEDAAPGDDFLAEVCAAWESAADPARDAGLRVVHPRTGVVLAAGGPLIDKVELPFRLGVGGKVGSGRQYVPWIALDDHVAAMRFLLGAELSGPVNVTAPEPVTNAELTRAIGRALRRPTVLPIPTLAIRALYGEMGESLATVSQRAVPHRLREAGFTHKVGLDEALRRAFAS